MTGPEHWREADMILTGSNDQCEYGCPHSGCQHEMRMLARAQVHATLAVAAATIDSPRSDSAATWKQTLHRDWKEILT